MNKDAKNPFVVKVNPVIQMQGNGCYMFTV
jgi:hypothetical protein